MSLRKMLHRAADDEIVTYARHWTAYMHSRR